MTREQEIELAWELHLYANTYQNALAHRVALKVRLCGEQNWRCCYCGARLGYVGTKGDNEPTFEHIVPKSKRGPDTENNLVISCPPCNRDRGDTMLDDHIEILVEAA